MHASTIAKNPFIVVNCKVVIAASFTKPVALLLQPLQVWSTHVGPQPDAWVKATMCLQNLLLQQQ